MKEAARMIGITSRSLRYRLKQGDLPTFSDPTDKRNRLILRADLERYLEPKPHAIADKQ
jgi:hypothetical protein